MQQFPLHSQLLEQGHRGHTGDVGWVVGPNAIGQHGQQVTRCLVLDRNAGLRFEHSGDGVEGVQLITAPLGQRVNGCDCNRAAAAIDAGATTSAARLQQGCCCADAQASRGGPLQKLASVDVAGSGVLFDELIQISTVTTIKCRHKAPPLLSV